MKWEAAKQVLGLCLLTVSAVGAALFAIEYFAPAPLPHSEPYGLVLRSADDGFRYPAPPRLNVPPYLHRDTVACGCGCPWVSDFLCSR